MPLIRMIVDRALQGRPDLARDAAHLLLSWRVGLVFDRGMGNSTDPAPVAVQDDRDHGGARANGDIYRPDWNGSRSPEERDQLTVADKVAVDRDRDHATRAQHTEHLAHRCRADAPCGLRVAFAHRRDIYRNHLDPLLPTRADNPFEELARSQHLGQERHLPALG